MPKDCKDNKLQGSCYVKDVLAAFIICDPLHFLISKDCAAK